jgi:Protein of unknown function (DUF2510)
MPDEPGWYPDPKGEANFRFYDGRRWTKSLAAERPDAVQEEQPPAVAGGLMGLLDVQPEFIPMEPEEAPAPRWAPAQAPNPNMGQQVAPAAPPAPAPAVAPPPPPPPAAQEPPATPPPPPPPPPPRP